MNNTYSSRSISTNIAIAETMDKQDSTVCPVCSLYLREGITLKSHLQTHSKEKVIEALLKQEPSASSQNEDSVLSNAPTDDENALNLNADNRFSSSSNRGNVSFSALSSSFLQSTNNQIVPSTSSLTYDANSIQYSPFVNNLVTQPAVNNSCNAVLTYQSYVTNEGNIIFVPVYSMCPPSSVMLSNNVVPPTPVINPCVVVPPPNTDVESMSISNVASTDTKYTSTSSVHDSNVDSLRTVEDDEEEGLDVSQSVQSGDSDDNEKATDDEVASIFKVSKPNRQYHRKKGCAQIEFASCDSKTIGDSKSDDESNAASSLKSEDSSFSSTPSEHFNEVRRTSVTPNVSVIRIPNNSSSSSPIQDEEDDDCASPLQSTSANTIVTTVISSSNAIKQRKCEALDLSENRNDSPSSFEEESEEYDGDENSEDMDETSITSKEEERYILPSGDVPHTSPVSGVGTNFNFIGISKRLLTSTSLISSVNKVFAGDGNPPIIFDTCEMMKSTEKQISKRTLTNYIMKMTDKDEEDYRMNVGENFGSACSSRVSPFDIQTDESMPARGELSGQESLSSTENSVWELQVQQNTCVERYSISCRGDNTDVKIGLHSLITDMNIKRDVETLQPIDFDVNKATDELVGSNFKNKRVREFHCFYCQKSFSMWKLRQAHIADEHAEEDGLTIETLFGKRLRLKNETAKIETSTQAVEATEQEAGTTKQEPEGQGNYAESAGTRDEIVCRMCSLAVKSTVDLLRHLKLSHNINKRSLVCPTCFASMKTTEEYREHIRKVHPYECMTCSKQFYTRPGYMLHQKRHMKVKPYSCDVCSKSFVTKQKLSEHMNIHTGEYPIKCDMCDSNFKRYSNYQQHKKYLHMNIKRKLKDFVCDCGEVFHSKVKLQWHQEIHDQKPKQCPFCVERYVHAASLTRHVRKWHNEMYMSEWAQTKKNVPCPVCNVSYLYTSLQTHMKIHEGVKPFACSECSKTFRTKWNLQLHRWTHMSRSAKPFKCKICVKAYIHKTDYDAHIRSHNNCRPYACNVCGRQFIRKYNCVRHMREHVEPRSYKCQVCGKEFARSYYLSEHEKVHTGEKPHICHFCGKASATKSNHNKHVRMHTVARETINSEA